MNMNADCAQERLTVMYKTWLDDLRETAPALLGPEYSNPYYISIPDGWFEAEEPRIMVVGEEGFGLWGCGKGCVPEKPDNPFYQAEDFANIQELNRDYLRSQLGKGGSSPINKSAFWNRFRRVSKCGVCCWTNIDKIHRLSDSKCVLSQNEQSTLHSVKTKVLSEEIDILQPTHIIFFGWHRISLQHELPDLFNEIYPKGLKDKSGWKEATIMRLEHDHIPCLFLYHPAWGYRNNGYEEEADQAIEALLQSEMSARS